VDVALLLFCWILCQRNTIIAGFERREHTRVSVGLVPLTMKFQFSTHINNFELTLSSLNATPYVLFYH